VNFFDMNKEGCDLRAEEELIVASFTRRLIEISAVSGARADRCVQRNAPTRNLPSTRRELLST
jgi:hypothetical protein